jgi:hypothetical protein
LKIDLDYSLHKAVDAKGKDHGLTRTEYDGEFTTAEDILSGTKLKTEVVSNPFVIRRRHDSSHGYLQSGKLYVPETGVWFFHVTSRGQATIHIDDWTMSGDSRFQGRVNLEKGFHDFSVIMADKAGGQDRLRVQWRRIDCARYRDIPEEYFYLE